MSEEGFEEWDAEFLDQLIQVEELALSSSSSTAIPIPIPNPNTNPSQSLFPPQQCPEPPPPFRNPTSYSPPRELSQRKPAFDSFPRSSNGAAKCTTSSLSSAPSLRRSEADKEFEIEHLKVSVQWFWENVGEKMWWNWNFMCFVVKCQESVDFDWTWLNPECRGSSDVCQSSFRTWYVCLSFIYLFIFPINCYLHACTSQSDYNSL